jgi:hypothetical protein
MQPESALAERGTRDPRTRAKTVWARLITRGSRECRVSSRSKRITFRIRPSRQRPSRRRRSEATTPTDHQIAAPRGLLVANSTASGHARAGLSRSGLPVLIRLTGLIAQVCADFHGIRGRNCRGRWSWQTGLQGTRWGLLERFQAARSARGLRIRTRQRNEQRRKLRQARQPSRNRSHGGRRSEALSGRFANRPDTRTLIRPAPG